ncbi:integral membrane protein MviN [Thermodesulfobacterium geofontis OPF15]|uniref:Probable lipid II flippase MurJ n=1 Tax=Thermodesulfobacterium geofontis (strain OPF15) TaxID=795359 RepID=F8C5S0_THEGP|nr:murein biosynthesis integral membrane protein MurJ [Thermodesulfobacterium geofontis]AEH23056.1 integral membrane protein MviN [Thermodesulfobacterium geofontis OPF15]
MKKIESITHSATSVTIAVFISRILGLIREQVFAYFFGAGKSMDAFVVGYRIPNLLRDLFAEGALGSAFVKIFSSGLEKEGVEKSFKIAQILISNFLVILIIIVLLGIIFANFIVSIIAPEFKKDLYKFILTTRLTQIMMPFLLFISLASILAGMLNSFRIFFLPALSSGLFNLVSIIIGIIGYYFLMNMAIDPIYAMAIGVTLGGLFQIIFQYPLVKNKGFSFSFSPDFKNEYFKEVLRLMFPIILGLSVVQINIFINTFFATSCGEGAVSWYSYAFRIMYVPLGLFGVGLSQALLPELSRQIARKDFTMAKDTFSRALIVSLSLSIPSAIGLFMLSHPLIGVLFERGKFTFYDTSKTSQILQILSLGLPFYGLSKTAVPLFYSLGKTIIPAFGSIIAVITNVVVILLTIKKLGINGVALGTSLSLVFQSLFLLAMAIYKLGVLDFKFTLRSLLTLILASLSLIGILEILNIFIFEKIFKIILSIPLGAIIFIIICKILGPEETYLFFEKFLKTLLRSK